MTALFSVVVCICLMLLAKISRTVLNSPGTSGHPCLIADLSGYASNFSFFHMMLTLSFSFVALIVLRNDLPVPNLLKIFYHERVFYFISAFFASIEIIIWFIFFNMLMRHIIFIDLLNNCCVSGVTPILV